MDTFRLRRHNLKKAIKSAKVEYEARLGCDSLPMTDASAVWNTLRTITN